MVTNDSYHVQVSPEKILVEVYPPLQFDRFDMPDGEDIHPDCYFDF